MLKIIKSNSEIKSYYKQCKNKSIPCVTLRFYSKNAVICGDFDSTGLKLSENQKTQMQQDQKRLIDKYGPLVDGLRSYGQFPYIRVSCTAAYKFAVELTKIMYKYAGVEPPKVHLEMGMPVAGILNTTKHQIAVRCPYCGMIHYHGTASFGGYVESHCVPKGSDNTGYFIKDLEK